MGVVYETLHISAQKTEKRGRDSQSPYVGGMCCYSDIYFQPWVSFSIWSHVFFFRSHTAFMGKSFTFWAFKTDF